MTSAGHPKNMATALTYTNLAGDPTYAVNYTSSNGLEYTDHLSYNIFGPLYVPRVYGKDLTSFEVASSGKIALTVNDIYSVDISRINESNKTYIAGAASNESLRLTTATSNAYIDLAAPTGTVTVSASNQLQFEAPLFAMSTDDYVVTASNSVGLFASDLAWVTMSNAELRAYAQDVLQATSSNFMSLVGMSNVSIQAIQQDVYLAGGSNISELRLTPSNALLSTSQGDVALTSATGAVSLSTPATTVTLTDTFSASTQNTMLLTALNSNIEIVGGSDTADWTRLQLAGGQGFQVTASNAVSLSAQSNMYIESLNHSLQLSVGPSNDATLTMSPVDHSIALSTASNVSLTGTSQIQLSSADEITLQSTGGLGAVSVVGTVIDVAASSNLKFMLSNDAASIQFVETQSAIHVFAASNVAITASNDFATVATGAVSLSTLSADGTSSNLFLMESSGAITAVGSNFDFAASHRYDFDVASSNIVRITQDKVTVNANLDVLGVINSIAVQNTDLHIEDKNVVVAYPGASGDVQDGMANTDSGLTVYGYPAGVDSNVVNNQRIYQKSIRWHSGTEGIDGLLTKNGLSNEAMWEFRGGSLRLTGIKSDGTEVSYGFRINHSDELELVRRVTDSNDVPTFRRVARFGGRVL